MANARQDAARWLPEARAGSSEALGQVLESCRGYLLLIAQQELDSDPAGQGRRLRPGAANVPRSPARFRHLSGNDARSPAGLDAAASCSTTWPTFAVTFIGTNGRSTAKSPCRAAIPRGLRGGGLDAGHPDAQRRLMRAEQTEALERAIARLPEDYRRVIQLRYREERSFEAIAELMQRIPERGPQTLVAGH